MILDTCALLWLVDGGVKLSPAARQAIGAAPNLYVSAISAFEIALKYRQGKLPLPAEPAAWFEQVIPWHRLQMLPVDLPVCLAAAGLPLHHRDPYDRLIIATAQLRQMPVITSDAAFTAYPVTVVW